MKKKFQIKQNKTKMTMIKQKIIMNEIGLLNVVYV